MPPESRELTLYVRSKKAVTTFYRPPVSPAASGGTGVLSTGTGETRGADSGEAVGDNPVYFLSDDQARCVAVVEEFAQRRGYQLKVVDVERTGRLERLAARGGRGVQRRTARRDHADRAPRCGPGLHLPQAAGGRLRQDPGHPPGARAGQGDALPDRGLGCVPGPRVLPSDRPKARGARLRYRHDPQDPRGHRHLDDRPRVLDHQIPPAGIGTGPAELTRTAHCAPPGDRQTVESTLATRWGLIRLRMTDPAGALHLQGSPSGSVVRIGGPARSHGLSRYPCQRFGCDAPPSGRAAA